MSARESLITTMVIVEAGIIAALVGAIWIGNLPIAKVQLQDAYIFAPVGQITRFEMKGMPCIQIQRAEKIPIGGEYMLAISSGVTCDWSKRE